jgi:RNA polymerase sigma-70 factor (sigma-E family)
MARPVLVVTLHDGFSDRVEPWARAAASYLVDALVNARVEGVSGPMEFDEFAAAMWNRLVRAGVLLGADPHAAEDLAQITLAQCFASWTRVSRAEHLEAYVHRMLVNAHTSSRRRFWWREDPQDRLPDTKLPGHAPAVEDANDLRAALRRLPLGQRQVIVLRYFADLTERQTADALDISLGTVKSRASRALATLADDPSLSFEADLPRGPRP